jgi:hypothetical protein
MHLWQLVAFVDMGVGMGVVVVVCAGNVDDVASHFVMHSHGNST